jgi:hypothetical protein
MSRISDCFFVGMGSIALLRGDGNKQIRFNKLLVTYRANRSCVALAKAYSFLFAAVLFPFRLRNNRLGRELFIIFANCAIIEW